MAECRKKDIAMMKAKGKNKGFGKGTKPPAAGAVWNMSRRQSGDRTILFGLEVRTPINEEGSEQGGDCCSVTMFRCGKAHTPFLDQKPRKYVKTAGSHVQNRFKRFVTMLQ